MIRAGLTTRPRLPFSDACLAGFAMKRILLVDDHPLLRQGLGRLIDGDENLRVCGMAANVADALALVESTKPDLVITDLTLPGPSGMELITRLAGAYPQIRVIVLTMHDESIYARRCLQRGAWAYLMKDLAPEELLATIRRHAQ